MVGVKLALEGQGSAPTVLQSVKTASRSPLTSGRCSNTGSRELPTSFTAARNSSCECKRSHSYQCRRRASAAHDAPHLVRVPGSDGFKRSLQALVLNVIQLKAGAILVLWTGRMGVSSSDELEEGALSGLRRPTLSLMITPFCSDRKQCKGPRRTPGSTISFGSCVTWLQLVLRPQTESERGTLQCRGMRHDTVRTAGLQVHGARLQVHGARPPPTQLLCAVEVEAGVRQHTSVSITQPRDDERGISVAWEEVSGGRRTAPVAV